MVDRIRRRDDFLKAAAAPAIASPGAVVQARPRGDANPARIGFTVTKKIGNAVERNRTRRRLKEAVRVHVAEGLQPGTDYVFIGRAATIDRPFDRLVEELKGAVVTLNAGGGSQRRVRPKQQRRGRPDGTKAS